MYRDTKCCRQEREEMFFSEGQAVLVFPALRLCPTSPPPTYQRWKARKDWLTNNVARPLSCYRTLSKDNFFSGPHQEASVCLTVRLQVLLWGAWTESQGAAWPARLGEEKGKFKPPNPPVVGLGKGTGQEQGHGTCGLDCQQNHFPLSSFRLRTRPCSYFPHWSRKWSCGDSEGRDFCCLSFLEPSWPWVMGKCRPLPPAWGCCLRKCLVY